MGEVIVLPPPVRREAEEILQRLPVAKRSEFLDAQHFAATLLVGPTPGIKQTIQITKEEAGAASYPTGYSLADVYQLGAEATRDARYCTIVSKMPLKNGQYAEPVALFENTSNGWRLVIPPTKFLTALWKRAEQTASANASGKDE